jgi:hypothetical protein
MMRRATWFVAGAAAGAVGVSYTRRKVKAVADQLAPVNVARGVGRRAQARGRDVVAALKEGRLAMKAKEDELRAERTPQQLPVVAPPAQIIVLSDLRDLERLSHAPERRISDDHPAAHSRRRRR